MRDLVTGFVPAAALALGVLIPGAAQATGSVSCTDLKADSGVDILLGAGPVPNLLRVSIALGERQLTTEPGLPGERVTVAQAYDDGELWRIDLVDDQATKRVAIIRLLRADHDSLPLQLGFVQLEGEPPVGLSCVGP
ncbi:hypothetical protein LL06_01940 [Hoeflea sp. BAL378]|uniref:hypothetical protein n=1 Tax=Hoeflea sp. BAL378 TaxID=1547437 RepID=UPI0005133AAE|nr:hypothetical protein [Hoeflea sp. BAL378]KGF70997.1 hypothetical protein LL06_01940 [Hoeflea sp. BAL378]